MWPKRIVLANDPERKLQGARVWRTFDTEAAFVNHPSVAQVSLVQPALVDARPRLVAVDLARALAVFMMVQGHCLHALLAPQFAQGPVFETWLWIRGLSSVMFTTLAGYAFAIATSKRWHEHVRLGEAARQRVGRLLSFFVLGYAMHFPVYGVRNLATLSTTGWRDFLQVDVLQAIYVSVLTLELLVIVSRTRRRFVAATLGLGTLVALATPLMRLHDWQATLPLSLAGYLYEGSGSNFPLFPWSGFALLGAGLGTLTVDWQRSGIEHVARRLLGVGAGLLGLATAWQLLPAHIFRPSLEPEDSSDFLFLRLGIALVLLGLLLFATRRTRRLPDFLAVVGRQSLLIYFAHVVLVYGSIWNPGLRDVVGGKLGPLATFGSIIAIETSMVLLALGWDSFARRAPHLRGPVKWACAIALAVPLL